MQTNTVVHLGFRQLLPITDVNQHAPLLDNIGDDEFLVLLRSYGVTNPKTHALQRRLVRGVSAQLSRSFELDPHTTISSLHDRAQSELWLRFADPPLPFDKHTHEIAAAYIQVLCGECNF
jgi:hypothetical protein